MTNDAVGGPAGTCPRCEDGGLAAYDEYRRPVVRPVTAVRVLVGGALVVGGLNALTAGQPLLAVPLLAVAPLVAFNAAAGAWRRPQRARVLHCPRCRLRFPVPGTV